MPYLLAVTIHLHLPDNGSLKGKRKELLSVRSAIARRFGAAIAEVDHQDLWQRSTLAAAFVSGSAAELQKVGASLERFLEARYPDGVKVEQRLVSFEDIA